jgi:hypothetical protein
VPTWKKSNPKHQPLKCSAGNHLWRHGLALAIYDKAGALTLNGEDGRTFFAKRETLSKFFGSHYNAACKAVNFLRRLKFLQATDKENHFTYIPHDKWALLYPGRCVDRDLAHYQEETDPFVGKLFALAQGSIRVKEHWIIGLKKLAPEEEILEMFAQQRALDIARRKSGDGQLTSPANSLYAVTARLKAHRK